MYMYTFPRISDEIKKGCTILKIHLAYILVAFFCDLCGWTEKMHVVFFASAAQEDTNGGNREAHKFQRFCC